MFYRATHVHSQANASPNSNAVAEWHPVDGSDERGKIRQRKKTVCIPTATTEGALWLPTAGELKVAPNKTEQRRLVEEVMIPLLFRPTSESREGCLPNEARWEVNQWSTDLVAQSFDLTSFTFWSTQESTACIEGELVRQGGHTAELSRLEVLHTLPRLNALTTVRLSHNYRLQELPIESLHCVRTIKYLDLSFNDLQRIPSILFHHPTEGQAFPDLLELHLHNNKLRSLPREIFLSRRLQRLNVENNLVAGFPSTLGNHCVKDGVLRTLLIGNNVLNSEMDDVTELQHAEASHDVWNHLKAQHLRTLECGSLARTDEQALQAERERMPLSKR